VGFSFLNSALEAANTNKDKSGGIKYTINYHFCALAGWTTIITSIFSNAYKYKQRILIGDTQKQNSPIIQPAQLEQSMVEKLQTPEM